MQHGLKGLVLSAALTSWVGVFGISNAEAIQYQRVPLDAPAVFISARGPIISGDFDRLVNFVEAMPQADRIAGFVIDSQGGNVFEAERLAGLIKRMDTSIFVDAGGQCSSACFLLFAAGSHLFVRPDALIGVHSVSENGEETMPAMALTTAMARDAAEFGVPPAIIGKLVQTPPGRATWLTPADLASMGVKIIDQGETSTHQPPVAALPENRKTPSWSPNVRPPALRGTEAYEEGAADRHAWEAWFDGLKGAYQEGAEYWAEQRSTPSPGSCYGPAGQTLGDWTPAVLPQNTSLPPLMSGVSRSVTITPAGTAIEGGRALSDCAVPECP